MKKISRNLWLKLAAFIVCSVMAAGLVVTTIVAVYTNNYESTAQLRDEIHANIAGAYSRQMVYNYESGEVADQEIHASWRRQYKRRKAGNRRH